MNLALILRNHAQRRPKHPAIISRDRSISYAEFDNAVDGVAGYLLKSGVSSGDIVAVALKDSPEHMIALFAVARMGAIILPIDRRWTGGEKQRTIEHFRAKVILVEPEDEPVAGDIPPLTLGNILGTKHERIADFEQAELPLVVSLSSGTTGRPKGPLLTHENFFARFQIYYISLTLNEHDRFACTSPLYFSGSRGFSMCILYAGATLVLLPPPVQTRELIREINNHGCTSAFVVPTIIRRLIAANEGEGLCFPNMRVLLSTGTVLFPEDRDIALRKVASNILNFYGSAEGGGVSVLGPHHPPEVRQSAGAIVFGSSVRVVDDNFRDLKPGTIGRISYRSPGSAKEFYRDPEATAQSFRNGWYFPGDLGYVDESGFVFITGRIKDLIIRAGVNIYPNEIESILLTHGAVREVAVIGVPSKEFGEEVVAYVVADSAINSEALRDFCTRNLAPYKVPTSFYFITELPRTSVGKIDKRLLSEKFT